MKKDIKSYRIIELLIIVVILLTFDISMMLRYNYSLKPTYYLITIASICIIPGIILLFKSSKRRFYLYVTFVFFNFAILVTDSCLFYYKGDLFSLGMFSDIGDGLKMGIKYHIFIAFTFWQWIIILAIAIGGIYLLKFLMTGKKYCFSKPSLRHIIILIMSFAILFSSKLFIKTEDIKLYDSPQDKRTYLLTFGMSTFNQKDFFNTTSNMISKSYRKIKASEELEQVDDTKTPLETDVTGSLSGKNVIMIMMETTEQYCIDPQLTPTLYKLLNEGYSFTNCYSVAKTNYTYDAEFKSLTSMMYYNTDNYMHSYDDNEFTNSLPSLLRKNGYTANSFHSYYGDYFNRKNMHQALGFERLYSYEDMTFSDFDYWPLDSEMFSQMKEEMAPIQDKPFFSFVITLSTHGAYSEPRRELSSYYEMINQDGRYAQYDPEFITLLAAQMDLDKGLSILVDYLNEKNLAENTVLVLFSDHKNYSSMETTIKYSGIPTNDAEYNYAYDIVPFAIYNPSINARKIDYMTSQYDILPTITDLLGIKIIKEYYYGQSVFLYDDRKYENRPIIMGYNRWIDPKMIVYDKQILWVDPTLTDVDGYFLNIQDQVFQTIEKFHAFFILDYFRETPIE